MKKLLFFLLVTVGIIITACNTTRPALSEQQKVDIEKQVLAQWDKVALNVYMADADSFMNAFSKDGFLAMYSQGKPFLTREEYSDSVKTWFGARKSAESEEVDVKVNVLAEDLALLDQKSIFQLNLNNGEIARCYHTVSFIFKKEASGWMIIHGNESWTDI